MRRIFLHITVFLFFVLFLFCALAMITNNIARAAPFLVCDPQTDVTHYVVIINDTTDTVKAFDLGDGKVILRYDLAGVPDGKNECLIRSKNEWGESVSVPFVFTKVLPGVLINVHIE